MSYWRYASVLVLSIWASVTTCYGLATYFNVFAPKAEMLIVDAKQVVRIFVDERGNDLSEEDMRVAIKEFDALVIGLASDIYQQSGSLIINSNHVLAGGRDISDEFGRAVIAQWDALQ